MHFTYKNPLETTDIFTQFFISFEKDLLICPSIHPSIRLSVCPSIFWNSFPGKRVVGVGESISAVIGREVHPGQVGSLSQG